VTADDVPVEQRLIVGAEPTVDPFAGPQTPLIADTLTASQSAWDPPFCPAHVHVTLEPASTSNICESGRVPAEHN
jgi:hypothetical protein